MEEGLLQEIMKEANSMHKEIWSSISTEYNSQLSYHYHRHSNRIWFILSTPEVLQVVVLYRLLDR